MCISPIDVRARTSFFHGVSGELRLIDVGKLEGSIQKEALEKIVNAINEDDKQFFKRVRKRFDVVRLEFPKVESRNSIPEPECGVFCSCWKQSTINHSKFRFQYEACLMKIGISTG